MMRVEFNLDLFLLMFAIFFDIIIQYFFIPTRNRVSRKLHYLLWILMIYDSTQFVDRRYQHINAILLHVDLFVLLSSSEIIIFQILIPNAFNFSVSLAKGPLNSIQTILLLVFYLFVIAL